jgi:hypothetical protein
MSGSVGDNTARASGVIASAGGGAILQVKSVAVTSTVSAGSSATPVALTAFDIAFTPTADNSVLCLQLSMQVGSDGTSVGGYFYDSTGAAKIEPYALSTGARQDLTFAGKLSASTRSDNICYTAWFTPGDATTRTIQVFGAAHTTNTLYINRSYGDNNTNTIDYARLASTFTITEYDGSIVTVA